MITVKYLGRFGNNLFQYAFGRVVAARTGRDPFVYRPIPLAAPCTAPLPTRVLARLHPVPAPNVLRGHAVDLGRLVDGPVRLAGFFQRYEYYRPFKAELRDYWLRLPAGPPLPDDTLTIVVRSGDIWDTGGCPIHVDYHALPLSYYTRVVEGHSWRDIKIVCDDPRDPTVATLVARYGAIAQRCRTFLDDFLTITRSSHIVLPVSTFAWWAAWLSNAKRIYYPSIGLLSRERMRRKRGADSPDLLVDEDRYEIMDMEDGSEWRGTPQDRARLLAT